MPHVAIEDRYSYTSKRPKLIKDIVDCLVQTSIKYELVRFIMDV